MKSATRLSITIIITCLACMLLSSLKAQEKDSLSYAVVIKFSSIGMGVPSDTPLRNYINSFKKKNKIKKITAQRMGPMGKEGEYWLAFSLKELTRKQKTAFKNQVKAITAKMTDRGQASCEENIKIINAELPGRTTMQVVIF